MSQTVSWKCWFLRQALPEMDMWDWLLGYETGVGKIERGKGRQTERQTWRLVELAIAQILAMGENETSFPIS